MHVFVHVLLTFCERNDDTEVPLAELKREMDLPPEIFSTMHFYRHAAYNKRLGVESYGYDLDSNQFKMWLESDCTCDRSAVPKLIQDWNKRGFSVCWLAQDEERTTTPVVASINGITVKNDGVITSLAGSAETVNTNYKDNSTTNASVTVDEANDALQISVTGLAAELARALRQLYDFSQVCSAYDAYRSEKAFEAAAALLHRIGF